MLKRSVVIKANKFKHNKGFRFDYKTLIFFTIFLCGLIIGVIVFKQSGEHFADFVTNILEKHLTACYDNNIFKNFCSVFFTFSVFLVFLFIFGLCAVGQPFIWFMGFSFGCVVGVVLSSYFCAFGILGVGYCALINIPCYAITAATLIKCCCESTKISNEIFFFTLGAGGGVVDKNILFKEYLLKYLVFLVPIAIAALLKACFLKLFSGLFSLVG